MKAKQMFDELGACAIEQGHSIKMDGRIYIDIIMIILFKRIIQDELNINDKTFWRICHYGRRTSHFNK